MLAATCEYSIYSTKLQLEVADVAVNLQTENFQVRGLTLHFAVHHIYTALMEDNSVYSEECFNCSISCH